MFLSCYFEKSSERCGYNCPKREYMFSIVATKMIVGILLLENVWWSPIFTLTFLKPERVWLSGLLGLKSQEKYGKLGGHRSRHTGIPLGPSEKFV